jgi:hypothetical protein
LNLFDLDSVIAYIEKYDIELLAVDRLEVFQNSNPSELVDLIKILCAKIKIPIVATYTLVKAEQE